MSNKLAKPEKNDSVFVRDESHLKNAKSWLIPVLGVSVVIMIACVVCGIICAVKGNITYVCICVGIFAALGIFGLICDDLNWIYNVTYTFDDGKLFYTYYLDDKMLPVSNSKVSVTVKNIQKYHVTKKKLVVYGDITKKAPMQKPHDYKKFELAIIPEHLDEIKSKFDDMLVK